MPWDCGTKPEKGKDKGEEGQGRYKGQAKGDDGDYGNGGGNTGKVGKDGRGNDGRSEVQDRLRQLQAITSGKPLREEMSLGI